MQITGVTKDVLLGSDLAELVAEGYASKAIRKKADTAEAVNPFF